MSLAESELHVLRARLEGGISQHFFAVDYLRALAGLALERRDLYTAEQLTAQALSISSTGGPAAGPGRSRARRGRVHAGPGHRRWSWPSAWRSPVVSTSAASPAACCPPMPRPPCGTRLFTSSRWGSGSCWWSGWSSPSGRSSPDPLTRQSRPVRRRRRGSTGSGTTASAGGYPPARSASGRTCTARSLRVGAVALVALIFVFWAQPTALVVILIVVLLLVVLGLIELIGRPPAEPHAAGQAVS